MAPNLEKKKEKEEHDTVKVNKRTRHRIVKCGFYTNTIYLLKK